MLSMRETAGGFCDLQHTRQTTAAFRKNWVNPPLPDCREKDQQGVQPGQVHLIAGALVNLAVSPTC